MSILDLVLTLSILLCLILKPLLTVIFKKPLMIGLLLPLHCLPLLLSIVHFLLRGFNYLTIPLCLGAIFLCLKYIFRRYKKLTIMLVILCMIATLLPSAFFLYMEQSDTKLTDIASASYVKSFQTLHHEIMETYPLAKHKGINYAGKYEEFLPYFMKAEQDNSKTEYFTALLQYLRSYHDGHFYTLTVGQYLGLGDSFLKNLMLENVGGSYGFTIIELDDGRVVVNIVKEGSAAQKAGIRQGTEISTWNGLPVKDAVSKVSVLWNYMYSSCANQDHIWRNQLSLLTRAPLGEQTTLGYLDENGSEQTITLSSEEDQLDLLRSDLTIYYKRFKENENLSYRILEGSHGYILLKEMPSDKKGINYDKFKKALEYFKSEGVKDLIIDLRGNTGGYDEFGAKLLGLLSTEPRFYLQELTYSRTADAFNPYRDALVSRPAPVGLNVPVILLVNHKTISAGEGFVYNASKLPQVKIAGMTGTNGSFGTITNHYLMPENYVVCFPQLVCVDQTGKIMIDTDQSLTGGIQPDIKIPQDENAIKKLYIDKADYELDYILDYLKA